MSSGCCLSFPLFFQFPAFLGLLLCAPLYSSDVTAAAGFPEFSHGCSINSWSQGRCQSLQLHWWRGTDTRMTLIGKKKKKEAHTKPITSGVDLVFFLKDISRLCGIALLLLKCRRRLHESSGYRVDSSQCPTGMQKHAPISPAPSQGILSWVCHGHVRAFSASTAPPLDQIHNQANSGCECVAHTASSIVVIRHPKKSLELKNPEDA
ncbi:hypothetical protein J3F84DRAFT_373248 [Trichoderma pleuroticola]